MIIINNHSRKLKQRHLRILYFAGILLFSNVFRFNFLPTQFNLLLWTVYLALFLFSIFYCIPILGFNKRFHFTKAVVPLTILPLLTIPISFSLYGQSPFSSFKALMICGVWASYYLFHLSGISEKSILKVLLFSALFTLTIQVIQQFTYPNALFGLMSEELLEKTNRVDNIEIRNGIYRFITADNSYMAVIVLLSSLSIYFIYTHRKYLVWSILMLATIYLTLTRQVLFATAIVLIFALFTFRKSRTARGKIYLILACGIIAVLASASLLFSDLISQTGDDFNEMNVRLLSLSVYGEMIFDNAATFLFGHGLPYELSRFGEEMAYWENLGLYTSDIGIVGHCFHYGFFYIIFAIVIVPILMIRQRNRIPTYIFGFLIFTFTMSVLIFPMQGPMAYYIWSSVFYISDLHINRSPLTWRLIEKQIPQFKI